MTRTRQTQPRARALAAIALTIPLWLSGCSAPPHEEAVEESVEAQVEPTREAAIDACGEALDEELDLPGRGNVIDLVVQTNSLPPQTALQPPSTDSTDSSTYQFSGDFTVRTRETSGKVTGTFGCIVIATPGHSSAEYSAQAEVFLDDDLSVLYGYAPTFVCRDEDSRTLEPSPQTIAEIIDNEEVGQCDVALTGELPTPEQAEALATAYPDSDPSEERRKLEILYGICTKKDPHIAINSVQLRETQGAAILCPMHPKVDALKTGDTDAMAHAEEMAALAEQNKLVSNGRYLVGPDIPEGTWTTISGRLQDCYWEISDAQGNILDNNFISLGQEITLGLYAGTGFTTDGCGSWKWISD